MLVLFDHMIKESTDLINSLINEKHKKSVFLIKYRQYALFINFNANYIYIWWHCGNDEIYISLPIVKRNKMPNGNKWKRGVWCSYCEQMH